MPPACRRTRAAHSAVLSIVVAPEAAGGAAFAGTVDARYESILGFRVLGRMIARDVNVGDNVKQGSRLAALDPTPFRIALRNAEADLAKAALICRTRNRMRCGSASYSSEE